VKNLENVWENSANVGETMGKPKKMWWKTSKNGGETRGNLRETQEKATEIPMFR